MCGGRYVPSNRKRNKACRSIWTCLVQLDDVTSQQTPNRVLSITTLYPMQCCTACNTTTAISNMTAQHNHQPLGAYNMHRHPQDIANRLLLNNTTGKPMVKGPTIKHRMRMHLCTHVHGLQARTGSHPRMGVEPVIHGAHGRSASKMHACKPSEPAYGHQGQLGEAFCRCPNSLFLPTLHAH